MKKKVLLVAAFVFMLLLLPSAAIQFVTFVQANPYIRDWEKAGEITPPEGTLPPIISIISPQNNTVYASNNVSLTLHVSMPESNSVPLHINELYYVPSWKHGANNELVKIDAPNGSISLTDVPEGPRWLEVFAVAGAIAYESGHKLEGIHYTTYYVFYKITSSSIVKFIIDDTAPRILSVSVESKTYYTSDLPLNVVVNEPASKVIYSLDGLDNVTATGNTTLAGLSVGEHNVAVYAWDIAGNVGASETIVFNITEPEIEPFPTTMLMAPIALVVVIGSGLLVYFKKRKR